MLQKFRSPFKLEGGNQESIPKSTYASINKGSVVVGLRILTQISQGKSNNIVVKSALRLSNPTSPTQCLLAKSMESCYLKSCYLCNKKLSLDKDVYMYRGDQGFCSIECRNRQIVLDDMRELESSTKKILASCRHCSTAAAAAAGRHETRILLEDLGQRGKPLPRQNHWDIII